VIHTLFHLELSICPGEFAGVPEPSGDGDPRDCGRRLEEVQAAEVGGPGVLPVVGDEEDLGRRTSAGSVLPQGCALRLSAQVVAQHGGHACRSRGEAGAEDEPHEGRA